LREALGIPPDLEEVQIQSWSLKGDASTAPSVEDIGPNVTNDDHHYPNISCDDRRENSQQASMDGAIEASFTDPPLDLIPNRNLRKVVSRYSRSLLQAFADRLPGFSKSSPPYLNENFLNFEAEVTSFEDRYEVRLGNPPLHLVLSMAGLNRHQFTLPASGDKPWILSQKA
jgi:hypothetical protein